MTHIMVLNDRETWSFLEGCAIYKANGDEEPFHPKNLVHLFQGKEPLLTPLKQTICYVLTDKDGKFLNIASTLEEAKRIFFFHKTITVSGSCSLFELDDPNNHVCIAVFIHTHLVGFIRSTRVL